MFYTIPLSRQQRPLFMQLTHMLQIATKALITNTLYGVSKEDRIIEFERNDEHPIYLLNIIRVLDFFSNDSPETVLFTLKIPYLVELNIEDDLEFLDHEKGLEMFWYNIQEVSPEIRMFDMTDQEIPLDTVQINKPDEVNWLSRDFLHGLCHASVFFDLLDENDSKFQFFERPNNERDPFLMDKLNLEQYLLLDLKSVVSNELLIS